jgi:hypothetical protein
MIQQDQKMAEHVLFIWFQLIFVEYFSTFREFFSGDFFFSHSLDLFEGLSDCHFSSWAVKLVSFSVQLIDFISDFVGLFLINPEMLFFPLIVFLFSFFSLLVLFRSSYSGHVISVSGDFFNCDLLGFDLFVFCMFWNLYLFLRSDLFGWCDGFFSF